MSRDSSDQRASLIKSARLGDDGSLGRLLELYRNYLYLVARTQIDIHLNVRVSPSDVVQETFLQACHKFAQFRGQTEAELLGWLRRILVNNIVDAFERHISVKKRDVRRERPLEEIRQRLGESSAHVDAALGRQMTSPSGEMQRRELAAEVADRLAELPSHYRDVIVLRNLEGLQFDEVAERMGRSSAAVRKLWTRAIEQLRLNYHSDGDS